MGETLKRVAQECRNDDVWTQMNGKWVLATPESYIYIMSMWLMKKSRKVQNVTNMQDECVNVVDEKKVGKFKMLIQICKMNVLVCQSQEHNWHRWKMMMTMCLQQV